MGLFGKKNVFLGIDFGTSSVKVVEMAFRNHRPELVNYGFVPVDETTDLAQALTAVLKKMKTRTHAAYVALPGSSGLVTLITFPPMSRAELEQAVLFEARKHIPIPMEEVNVSWDIVARSEGAGAAKAQQGAAHGAHTADAQKDLQVLLVAAPRKDVAEYEGYIAQTKLTLSALELETFALTRALVGDDLGRFLIADIGARATNIILVEKGVIRANRNVGIGGANITHSIAESMSLDVQRAEVYKCERDDLLGPNGIARQTVDVLVEELRRVGVSDGAPMPQNVIITGGASAMKGMTRYMGQALGTTVSRGNPWARVTLEKDVVPHAKRRAGMFCVAVGLALRGIEEYQRS